LPRTGALVGSLLALCVAIASAQWLPADLAGAARAHSCGPVDGFFDRPGLVDPPYVYGFLGRVRERSAAFWCQRHETPRAYLLVFVWSSQAGDSLQCPDSILWTRFPGGLTLSPEHSMSLDGFKYVDDKKPVPPGQHTAWPPVISDYDGVSELFYCYMGRWVYQVRH